MISGALSGLLAASKFLFAMAKDKLLPDSLSETNNKFETPHWAIIPTAVTMAVCILTPEDVAKLASGFQIMVIVALNVSVIVLRKENNGTDWYQPTFKSPLYPYVQVFGTIAGAYLVVIMDLKIIERLQP